jgi:hypothetical protein
MWFSRGRNKGFTWVGMSVVNKCLGSLMLASWSTKIMRRQIEISMHLLEQQLFSTLSCSQVTVVNIPPVHGKTGSWKNVVISHYWWSCLDYGWADNVTAILRPMMTQRDDGWAGSLNVLLFSLIHFCCVAVLVLLSAYAIDLFVLPCFSLSLLITNSNDSMVH